jgi:hypothetical protein
MEINFYKFIEDEDELDEIIYEHLRSKWDEMIDENEAHDIVSEV